MNRSISSGSGRTRRIFRAAVSAAAVLSLSLAIGCGNDGDDDEGDSKGDPNVIGIGGSKLVGDWSVVMRDIPYQNQRLIISLKSSGEYCVSSFQKVDNFWVEGTHCHATWWADDKHIHTIHLRGEGASEYTIADNTLTICSYYDDDDNCEEEMIFTKGNHKPSGKIHSGDPALVNTEWSMLTSNEDYFLYFNDPNHFWFFSPFSNANYFNVNPNCGGAYCEILWYTNGSKLHMLHTTSTVCESGEDWYYTCIYGITEEVEFSYTHVPGVSLTLKNESRGINDVWIPRNDGSYKRRAESTAKRQSPFRCQ